MNDDRPARLPRVTIGLPVYNGEDFLEEAIGSIRAQTYEDFELVVSDNASTDRTREIVADHAAEDQRVRPVFREENLGPMKNFNGLVPLARGEFFQWMAHDDILAPTALERCVPVLEQDETVVLSHGRTVIIDADGVVVAEPDTRRMTDSTKVVDRIGTVLWEGYCHQIFGLIRTEALRGSRPMGAYANGDAVLLLRLSLLGRFHEVPETLLFYRHHAAQSIETARTDYREYSAWFDPANEGKIFLPRWRIAWEFFQTIGSGPISPSDKIRGLRKLAGWGWHSRSVLIQDVWHAGRKLARRTLSDAPTPKSGEPAGLPDNDRAAAARREKG